MAANTQFQADAFQLAEDGIELVLANRRYGTNADDERNIVDWLGDPDHDRRAEAVYVEGGNTPAPGYSIGELEAFHFEITSVGRGSRGGVATHRQGFYVVGRTQ